MQKKLTCEQVLALLNFYAEGCLTEILARHVTEHLEECESCRQNYFQIKKGNIRIFDAARISFHIFTFAVFTGKRQTLFLITSEHSQTTDNSHKNPYHISYHKTKSRIHLNSPRRLQCGLQELLYPA